ncbi:MAG: baeRF3 domain-containing protein [Acidimicrobiia bacterium]
MSARTFGPSDLGDLRALHAYPAVSILLPLQRHRPGNPEDPLLLRSLADEAAGRVRRELDPSTSSEIVARLDDAIAAVDWHDPSEGLAMYVAPGESRLLALPFAVAPRVAIGQRFATRELVRGVEQRPRYRVLALGEKPTRLLEGQGSVLAESRAPGFPCFVEGAHGEPLASGGFQVHSSRSEEQHREFFRLVDDALGAAADADPVPLIVAGTQRDLAYFDEVTRHAPWVAGRVEGNFEDASPAQLGRLVAPLVDGHVASQRAATIANLVEAVGTGRAVVGIKPAWVAARAGRARTLVVEDDFVYPAREVDGGLEPVGDPAGPGVFDDAVDELIDIVLASGGDVVSVEAGRLGEHGPVALLLRY